MSVKFILARPVPGARTTILPARDEQLLALLPVALRERTTRSTIRHLDQAPQGPYRRRYSHARRTEPVCVAVDTRQLLRAHPRARGRAPETHGRDPAAAGGKGNDAGPHDSACGSGAATEGCPRYFAAQSGVHF